ncbi:MAG: leucine-rich repeat protein [Clostridia bacterium]
MKATMKRYNLKKILILMSCALLLMAFVALLTHGLYAVAETTTQDETVEDVYLDLENGDIVIGDAEYIEVEEPEIEDVPEVEVDTEAASIAGYLTDTIPYELDDGILTIYGTGEMPDFNITYDEATNTYSSTNLSPFYGNEYIERVVISSGITKIGAYTFYNCPNLEGLLTIPSTVAEIGDYAFSGNSYANAPKFTQIFNEYDGEQTLGENIFYDLADEDYDYSTYDFVYVYNKVTKNSHYVSKSSTYESSTVRGLYSAIDSNSNFGTIMQDLGYKEKTGEISWSSGNTSINYVNPVTGASLSTTNKLIFYSYTDGGNSYYFIPSTIFDLGLNYSSTTDPLTEIEFWQSVLLTNTIYQSIADGIGLDYEGYELDDLVDSYTVKRFFIGSTFVNSVYLNSGATLGMTKSGTSNSNSIFSSSYDGTNAVIADLNIPTSAIPDVTIAGEEVTDPTETTTETTTEPTTEPTTEATVEPEEDHWEFDNIYTYYDENGSKQTETYDENTVFHIIQTGYDAETGEGVFTQNTLTITGEIDVVVYLEGVYINTLGDEVITNSSGTTEITTTSTTGRKGDAAILVENRADTILVIADETINSVQSNGNRAGIEKASASTNYDYELLYLEDWYEIDQNIELEDGHLTIASESAYAAIVAAGDEAMITETETGQNIVVEDGEIVRDGVNPAYEEVTYEVEKYDYEIFEGISTENDGTLNVTGGSNTNTQEGAGIGTRGVSGEDEIIVDVDLANLHIVGGNITSIAYGTHAGGAGIGTGAGRTSADFDFGSSAKNFNIYAGNIEAGSTGAGAADIGGGFASSYAVINIYGGNIETMNITGEVLYEGDIENENDSNRVWKFYASSQDIITVKRGAGIGGGGGGTATSPKAGATVNIYGGDITAYSDAGAAIGGGGGGSKSTAVGQDGTVNIYGGTIYAESSNGAAIGSGGSAGSGSAETGIVNIYDGDITAVIYAREDELDKPEGYDNSTRIDLDGTGAAIGGAAGGTDGSGGEGIVTITGGTVSATNYALGSAIGGGGSIVQDGGDATILISGGDITVSSESGTDIGGGSSEEGNGGDVSEFFITGQDTIVLAQSIGGGSSVDGNGGDVTSLTIEDATLEIDGFIGGGSSESGKGGDVTSLKIDDATLNINGFIGGGSSVYGDGGSVVDLTVLSGLLYVDGYVGGGSSTYANGGDVTSLKVETGTIEIDGYIGGGASTEGDGGDATVIIGLEDSTVDSAFLTTVSIGGGSSVKGDGGDGTVIVNGGELVIGDSAELDGFIGGGSSEDGDGGDGNVTIHRGFITVYGTIGGGNTVEGAGGEGDVFIEGGTTKAVLIGSGFSETSGYARAKIIFNGGSVNSQATIQPSAVWEDENYSELVYLTRICIYSNDLLQSNDWVDSLTFSDGTFNDNFGGKDIVTDELGFVYFWMPEVTYLTDLEADDVEYEGSVLAKSVDILRYNCVKNYYNITFPYSDSMRFYSDEELSYEFAGSYSGVLSSAYGQLLDFYVQTDEITDDSGNYYTVEAYYSSIVDGEGVMLPMSSKSDSDPENGYYHYELTVTTSVDLLFKYTNTETGEEWISLTLSDSDVVVTENTVTFNGYTLNTETRNYFFTSSGIPTDNTLTFENGNDEEADPVYNVYADRVVIENDGSILNVLSDTVNLTFSEFDNSLTSTSRYDSPITVADGATLNILDVDDQTNVLTVTSTISGVPAISGDGNIVIEDTNFLELNVADEDTPQIVGKNFTYIDEDGLTGTVPYTFESTQGELVGYNYTDEDGNVALYPADYEYEDASGTFVATTVKIIPSDAYTFEISEDNEYLILTPVNYDEQEDADKTAIVYTTKDGEETDFLQDFEYSADSVYISAENISGNIQILVGFYGEVFANVDDYIVPYTTQTYTFPFQVLYPTVDSEDIESINISYYAQEYDEDLGELTEEEYEDLDFQSGEISSADVGKQSIFIKVEVDYVEVDGDIPETRTEYFGPYTFEVYEASNEWIINLSCPSVRIDEVVTAVSTAKWGEAIYYFYDPLDKEGTITKDIPTEPDRYNAISFVPASFPESVKLPDDFDMYDINSYDSYGYPIDENGDRLTDGNGDEIPVNYPAIFSQVVFFDIQDTATYTIDEKVLLELDDSSNGVQILVQDVSAPVNGDFTIGTMFTYHYHIDEDLGMLFTGEDELPVGTRITMIDFSESTTSPYFYYYIITGEEEYTQNYDYLDEELVVDSGIGLSFINFTQMGTTDVPWVNHSNAADGIVAYALMQFCFEFPDGYEGNEDEEYSSEYLYDVVDFSIKTFDEDENVVQEIYDDDTYDYTIIQGYSNVELDISLTLDDPIIDPGKITVDYENNLEETIQADITVSGVAGSNDYLALQFYDDSGKITDLPTGASLTYTNSSGSQVATLVKGGYVLIDVSNGVYSLEITGMPADTYNMTFSLCTDAVVKAYPMADVNDEESVSISTISKSYSIKAELADNLYDNYRLIDGDDGEELEFTVSYYANYAGKITVDVQKKEDIGVYVDMVYDGIDTWVNTAGISVSKTDEGQTTIYVTVPSGTEAGTYRINFNLGDATYAYNIIVK